MNKLHPKTITLKEFYKHFTPKQRKIVEEEKKYLELLMQIKQSRERKGLSQEQLAQKANINRTTLSKVESGLRNATVETLTKITQAMDMKLEFRLKAA